MKRFLVLAGFEAGIATALLIMAVSRLANPVPAGDKNVSILRFCEGMRVVDVPVNEVDGVTGLTLAGMHVDVLISGKPPHWIRTLGIRTNTLLRNIEVFLPDRTSTRTCYEGLSWKVSRSLSRWSI